MSRMIQVRNVPESVHRTLKLRATAAGMSLSDYVKRDLVAAAARPSLDEIDQRVAVRGSAPLDPGAAVDALRELRER